MKNPGNPNPDKSGLVAPWKKGESGNAKGRPSAGGAIREYYNLMHEWPEDRLIAVMNDKSEGFSKRKAAEAILNMGAVDVEAYESLLDGSKTLADLKREGVRTNTIRRVKRKTRTEGEAKTFEYEVEFADKTDAVTEAIIGHTDGKAIQRVETTGNLNLNQTPADDVLRSEMAKIRAELMGTAAPAQEPPEPTEEPAPSEGGET